MRGLAAAGICWFLILLSAPAAAKVEAVDFDTREQEALYAQLVDELRCLVCANQSLSDSNSGLAQDLRRKTAEMIKDGKDRQAIIDYMVERFGQYILYRPPLSLGTLLLWFGPFLMLLAGGAFLFHFVRSQRLNSGMHTSPEKLEEARALLVEDADR